MEHGKQGTNQEWEFASASERETHALLIDPAAPDLRRPSGHFEE